MYYVRTWVEGIPCFNCHCVNCVWNSVH